MEPRELINFMSIAEKLKCNTRIRGLPPIVTKVWPNIAGDYH